jgi:hypothetical protein
MADDVEVKFGANTKEADAGITEVGEKLRDLDNPVREILESFGQLRRTFVEAFAIDEIAEFVAHMSEMGEEAVRNSAMLGMSVEKVQELSFAARMVGGDADGMSMGLMHLERSIAEAGDGSSKAAQSFTALGISQAQLKNSSPEQVLGLIANAFHNAQDGADKTAIAMDLMGRMGAQMIPLLNQGSQGLEQMGVLAKSTGSILTEVQAEGLEKTAQSITTLKANVEGVGVSLLEVFKPGIDAVISGLTTVIGYIRAFIDLINVAVQAIEGGLLLGLAAVIEKAEEMAVRVGDAFNTVKLKAEEVTAVLGRLAHGDLQGAVNAQVSGEREIAAANDNARAAIQSLGNQYDQLKTKIENATEAALKQTLGIQKEAEGEEKNRLHAPTGAQKEDDTDTQIALNNIKTEEELAKIGLQTQKDMLDQEVAAKKLTKAQEYATLQDYLTLEYQAEAEALAKRAALYDEDTKEYQEAINQKKILDAQFEQQMARLGAQGAQAQAEQAKQMQAAYKPVFDSLGTGLDQVLQGVLQGTQSWNQAMGRLFDDLAIKFVEAVAKMIAEWAIFEATEGAGILGFGMVNPFAGAAAALPSFDVGSWSIPSNMVAMVHQGEMIVPAQQAAAIRSGEASLGASSGGGQFSMTVNLNAIDTQTGVQFLKSNMGVIAQGMNNQMRNFNKNLRT